MVVVLGVKGLDVVRVFSDDEVSQSQMAKGEWLLSDGCLKLVQFWRVFFEDLELGSFVIFVEEKCFDGSADLIEDGKDGIKPGSFLYVPSQKRFLAPTMTDVPLNCLSFCDAVISIDQVRQVGETEPRALLVLLEPLIRIFV